MGPANQSVKKSCRCNGERKEKLFYYLAKTVAILSAIAGES